VLMTESIARPSTLMQSQASLHRIFYLSVLQFADLQRPARRTLLNINMH
jgi:hypothetical protein